MSNNKLFKDAIVDAKAIREAALLNAKEALEEALTPSIQNMLVAKLNEMDMTEEEYGMGAEEATMEGEEMDEMYSSEEMGEGDFDLSAILAELEAEEMEESLNEAKEEEEEEETEDEEE